MLAELCKTIGNNAMVRDNDISIKKLERFLLAAKCGSFEKAAAASQIHSASLIRCVNQMEKELEVSLFVRSPQGITLTAEGQIFKNYAIKAIQDYNDVVDKLHGDKVKGRQRWDNRMVQALWELDADTRNALISFTEKLVDIQNKAT